MALLLLFGIGTFAIAWSIRAGRFHLATILILLLAAGPRVHVSLDPCLHPWDERYHALVAANIADHGLPPTLYADPVLNYDPADWSSNHVWLHKPPVPLVLMAGSIKLFGRTPFAVRIPTLVLSILAVWLTLSVGRALFGPAVGAWAGLCHALNGFLIEGVGGRVATDHIDQLFLVFVLAAAWFAVQARNMRWWPVVMSGLLIGLAVLTKSWPALIVLPVAVLLWGGMSWRGRSIRVASMLAIAVLVALPWQIWTTASFPVEAGIEAAHRWQHITQALDGMAGGPLDHLDRMRILFGELIYVIVLVFLVHLVRARSMNWWAIALWLAVPYLFFSIVRTKMPGYILFAAPALFLIQGWFFATAFGTNGTWISWTGVMRVIAIAQVVLLVRYGIERTKPFAEHVDVCPDGYAEAVLDHPLFEDVTDRTVVVGHPFPIEAMFHHPPATVYGWVHDNSCDSLSTMGWDVRRIRP